MVCIAKGQFKPFNKYKIEGDTTIIYLEKRDGRVFECLIDTGDLPKLKQLGCRWNASYHKRINGYYAQASIYFGKNIPNKTLYMHKIILDIDDGRETIAHHKSPNTLDNRKENLEITTNKINVQLRHRANSNNKTTGIRNVTYIKRNKEYWVQIMKDGISYKWVFSKSQFDEACDFAKSKRKELFGKE